MRSLILCFFLIFSTQLYSQNVLTVDFETAGEGYTPSGTHGSGYTDVFNRSNSIHSNCTNADGYFWAAEDITLGSPYIDIDQIDVTGATSFTFLIDLLAYNGLKLDSTDEVKITYSTDGGLNYSNLLWIQSVAGSDNYNVHFAIDPEFDGSGNCTNDYLLPHIYNVGVTDDNGCGLPLGNNFKTFLRLRLFNTY